MKKLYNTPNAEMILNFEQDVIRTSLIIEEKHDSKIDGYAQDKAAWN